MAGRIFARERELKLLEKVYSSGKAEFLAVYGRRRVGKPFLIREFFKDRGLYFALTGIKNASRRKQLKNFSIEFERVFGSLSKNGAPKDWLEALTQLRKAIQSVKGTERITLFFDELPWLATPRSEFLQDLDHFWNRYMSEDARVILIVCGSAASWMIKKIVQDKGGLHGRLTATIRLMPFSLKETEEFLAKQGVTLTRRAIIDVYMAIGGIPKYLTYVQKGQSAMQVVNQLCFNGPLVNEFGELYASLFEDHMRHINVVKALATCASGLTKLEIAKSTGLSAGGGMNIILDDLEQSGFILPTQSFGKQKKDIRFKLIDEYSLFYLKWIAKSQENSLKSQDDNFWVNIFNNSVGLAWAGYAFETVCLKHLSSIKIALGIGGVLTAASSWVFRSKKGRLAKGVQIDLVIDRADNCINLCEMKYCNEEFVVSKLCDQELREKKSTFMLQTHTKKSLFLTLIAPYGIKQNAGYFDAVDVVLTMDALFHH